MKRLLLILMLGIFLLTPQAAARKARPARAVPAPNARRGTLLIAHAAKPAGTPKPIPNELARKGEVIMPPLARKHRTVKQRKEHHTTRQADLLLTVANIKKAIADRKSALGVARKKASSRKQKAAPKNQKTTSKSKVAKSDKTKSTSASRTKQISELVWMLDNGELNWSKHEAVVDRSKIDKHVKARIIAMFDKNKDGMIDLRERYQFDRSLWQYHSKQRRAMISQFDADRNGSLNAEEMIAASDAHRHYVTTTLMQFQLVKPDNLLKQRVRTAGVAR